MLQNLSLITLSYFLAKVDQNTIKRITNFINNYSTENFNENTSLNELGSRAFMFWYLNERDSGWFFGLGPRGFFPTWYIVAIQDGESLAFLLQVGGQR